MKSQNQESASLPAGKTVFIFNGVPVVTRPDTWPVLILVTGVLTWIAGLRRPDRSWPQRIGVGLLSLPVALLAEIGHAMAHTVSARLAGAPMDEIFFSASSGMTRTLYENNAVPPRTHIRRSLGGPIFSLLGFALSLAWRRLSPYRSLNRELAEISLVGHSIILLGSIAPLPMVDGGIILKWKLVNAGQSPDKADRTVKKTSLCLGAAFLGLGVGMGLIQKRRLIGALLAAGGAAGIAAGVGWLK